MTSTIRTALLASLASTMFAFPADAGKPIELSVRRAIAVDEGAQFHTVTESQTWDPASTALIVCDMWDAHHCRNAVGRVGEMVPRMNAVLKAARERGVTIIHAPSSCTGAYAMHPARRNAKSTPRSEKLPTDIGKWCHSIPAEERGVYPIDQSDGGEDDDPIAHAEWAVSLLDAGLNPGSPWKRQVAGLDIAPTDYLSDDGEEIWSILEFRGLDNVIVLGVHTNMCVLGRPFGLRQMARNGKRVVLMRDLTDTMYNPHRPPYVSHFTGTDRIVEHIEKYVCPTITSTAFLGGEEFRFAQDDRKHLVIVMGEREYETKDTLPAFAKKYLGHDFRVTLVHAGEKDRNDFPGIDAVEDADVLLLSVRRRALPTAQLKLIRDHVASGKPVVAVRTTSHAFALRGGKPPKGHDVWPEFDKDILGGNYTGHHGGGPKVKITLADDVAGHELLAGIDVTKMIGNGSLYRTSPLTDSATPLLIGAIPDKAPEPVAWINAPKSGSRVFYTALAHPDDFDNPAFTKLMLNAIYWAAKLKVPAKLPGEPVSKRVQTSNVDGIVTLAGRPLAGAVVVFRPTTENGHTAAGWTDSNGRYRLRTFARGDGAPSGTYRITVSRRLDGRETVSTKYNAKTTLTGKVDGATTLNLDLSP